MMTSGSESVLQPMLRKLSLWQSFDDDDVTALLALPYTLRSLKAGQLVAWDGDKPQHSCLLLSGFAFRHKIAGDGARQILSIHMRGDMIDLHNALLRIADHNIQMLTAGELAMIPFEAIRDLAAARPNLAAALWYETLVDGSILREWIINVGRRDARTRIAHLLCELAVRQEVAGLGDRLTYQMPMTQEQLSDAVGLTPVHVNRMLMSLGADGLIDRNHRSITVLDWAALAKAGDFEPRYLHFEGRATARK